MTGQDGIEGQMTPGMPSEEEIWERVSEDAAQRNSATQEFRADIQQSGFTMDTVNNVITPTNYTPPKIEIGTSPLMEYIESIHDLDYDTYVKLFNKYANGYNFGLNGYTNMGNQMSLQSLYEVMNNGNNKTNLDMASISGNSNQILADFIRDAARIKVLQAMGKPIKDYENVKMEIYTNAAGRSDLVIEYGNRRFRRGVGTNTLEFKDNGQISNGLATALIYAEKLEGMQKRHAGMTDILPKNAVEAFDNTKMAVGYMTENFLDAEFTIEGGRIVEQQRTQDEER